MDGCPDNNKLAAYAREVEVVESVDAHISFDSGVSFESSVVTPMEPGVYRLEVSPVFSEVASFGDIIEAEEDDTGKLHFRRIISRAELRAYRWLLSQRIVESEESKVFCDNVMQAGGMWERAWGGIVIVHVPLDSGFDPEIEIERIIQAKNAEAAT